MNGKIPESDKVKPNIAISALSSALSRQSSRWLLCMGNVDEAVNPEVSAILDAVCTLVKPSEENGCIVVTSRIISSSLWSNMKTVQKITLEPFALE